MTKELHRSGKAVNHKRIERIMKQEGIRSKVARKFKATTNSKHDLPVVENILNRQFVAEKPNQKLVADSSGSQRDRPFKDLFVATQKPVDIGQIFLIQLITQQLTDMLPQKFFPGFAEPVFISLVGESASTVPVPKGQHGIHMVTYQER